MRIVLGKAREQHDCLTGNWFTMPIIQCYSLFWDKPRCAWVYLIEIGSEEKRVLQMGYVMQILLSPLWTDMRHASHSRDNGRWTAEIPLKIWIVCLFTMKRMIGSWRLESSVIHCHLCILFNMYGVFWCHILVDMFFALFQQLMLALFP